MNHIYLVDSFRTFDSSCIILIIILVAVDSLMQLWSDFKKPPQSEFGLGVYVVDVCM